MSPQLRVEALKGMNSSAPKGSIDQPYFLQNVTFERTGGYRVSPDGVSLTKDLVDFKQFSVARYAFIQTNTGVAGLLDLDTKLVNIYPELSFRDVVVYGDLVVTAGQRQVTGKTFEEPFAATSMTTGIVSGNQPFTDFIVNAFDMTLGVQPLVPDIAVSCELIPAPGSYIKTPASYTAHYAKEGEGGWSSGDLHLIAVYFKRRTPRLNSSINPGVVRPAYLPAMMLMLLPQEPTTAGAAPIYGEYHARFTFTGMPEGYDPEFYSFARRPRNDHLTGTPAPYTRLVNSTIGSTADVFEAGDTAVITTNGSAGMWLALGPPIDFPVDLPVVDTADIGDKLVYRGATLVFVGYVKKPILSPPEAAPEDAQLYEYLISGLSAPLFLMADYINVNKTLPPSQISSEYWTRLKATEDAGVYTVIREPHLNLLTENPPLSTFFPIGSRSVNNGGRVWVAADYTIRGIVDASTGYDRHAVRNIMGVQRERANGGRTGDVRTVYYSEPNLSSDFRESFIIIPFRRSHTITALASTSGGVMVFGDSDGCLISGDSLANFRVTAVDVPGAISQATVGSYRGAVLYATLEGLYMMDGSMPQLVSDPVSREWGIPTGLSIDDVEGTVLITFTDRPGLFFDIRRQQWALWTAEGKALPVAAPYHITAEVLDGSANLVSYDGAPITNAQARFLIDGGVPGIRKSFNKLSHRREGSAPITVKVRTDNGAWQTLSTTQGHDPNSMMYVMSQAGNALDIEFGFNTSTILSGPLVVDIPVAFDARDIK